MREDVELCSYFKFHHLKIYFFLASMRQYRTELTLAGLEVTYQELAHSRHPYEFHLLAWTEHFKLKKILLYEIEDKFFSQRILASLKQAGVTVQLLPSPMFLTSRSQFADYLKTTKRPFMKSFYQAQRHRLQILIEADGKPVGGQWSFDELNRKSLPKTLQPPEPERKTQLSELEHTALVATCQTFFPDHPGTAATPWFPVERAGARRWLKDFIDHRLASFGPYEDALTERSDFVFHSGLSPFLNCGWLTPEEVVRAILAAAAKKNLPLNSIEGFIRQVIGWREFIRGIYQHYSTEQDQQNFWGHHRKLTQAWYQGNTGVGPLDQVIAKVQRLGYAHHIERLMVVSNLMLLLEIHPQEAHRWFMEMFLDSSDWVMGPNVYGMGLFSDGGIFATKPYICGSNYYRKMGDTSPSDWHEAVDGLYWGFIDKHQAFFLKNPRLSMMVRSLAKINPERKSRIYAAAEALKQRITAPPTATTA